MVEQRLATAQQVSSVRSPVLPSVLQPWEAAFPRSRPCCAAPGVGWGRSHLRGAHTWGAEAVSAAGASWHGSPHRSPAAGANGAVLPQEHREMEGGGLSPLPFREGGQTSFLTHRLPCTGQNEEPHSQDLACSEKGACSCCEVGVRQLLGSGYS